MNALDALGNPVRRDILQTLRAGPASVAELAAPHDISRPAISRHLKLLEQAHLVRHHGVGRKNLYELDRAGFTLAEAWLGSFWDEALTRFALLAHNLEQP